VTVLLKYIIYYSKRKCFLLEHIPGMCGGCFIRALNAGNYIIIIVPVTVLLEYIKGTVSLYYEETVPLMYSNKTVTGTICSCLAAFIYRASILNGNYLLYTLCIIFDDLCI